MGWFGGAFSCFNLSELKIHNELSRIFQTFVFSPFSESLVAYFPFPVMGKLISEQQVCYTEMTRKSLKLLLSAFLYVTFENHSLTQLL